MKVICITFPPSVRVDRNPPSPEVGDIDTVINEGDDDEIGEYYCLERFGLRIGYSKSHFAIISSIDETTFERNYNKELA